MRCRTGVAGWRGVTRSVLVVAHTGRAVITDAARHAIRRLQDAGVHVRALGEEVSDLGLTGIELCDGGAGSAADAELVLVLGGDGSILRAAELARAASVPLLGVNLGRVGFLAEAESEDLDHTLDRVLDRDYAVEERLTLDVSIVEDGQVVDTGWALNECSVEKAARERMLELVVEVDGRPLSRWGCDGVVAATPTGSTAYAFSAGGPGRVADGRGAARGADQRPRAVQPGRWWRRRRSVVAFEVLPSGTTAVVACDGRRTRTVGPRRPGRDPSRRRPGAARPHARRAVHRHARRASSHLPVEGWRGARERLSESPRPSGGRPRLRRAGGDADPRARRHRGRRPAARPGPDGRDGRDRRRQDDGRAGPRPAVRRARRRRARASRRARERWSRAGWCWRTGLGRPDPGARRRRRARRRRAARQPHGRGRRPLARPPRRAQRPRRRAGRAGRARARRPRPERPAAPAQAGAAARARSTATPARPCSPCASASAPTGPGGATSGRRSTSCAPRPPSAPGRPSCCGSASRRSRASRPAAG